MANVGAAAAKVNAVVEVVVVVAAINTIIIFLSWCFQTKARASRKVVVGGGTNHPS